MTEDAKSFSIKEGLFNRLERDHPRVEGR